MNLMQFLKLVEIQTKVASVIPFLFGTLYTLYTFDSFSPKNALLMFVSMLIFDMTTTAINNYIDYTTAHKKSGYGYEVHNIIGKEQLDLKKVRHVIYAMLCISACLGFILFLNTNIIILLLGMLCFSIGILYTFGPLPISRTPFGEAFSGLTMGLLLTFISIYIHIYDQNILSVVLNGMDLNIYLNLKVLVGILLVCIPLICCIANIMLANNLCDMEDDLINKRYTLPIYVGKKLAIILWEILYWLSYFAIIIAVMLKYLPWMCLLTLLTLIPVNRHIKIFVLQQSKKETFIMSIKNFLIINGTYIITLLLGLILLIN